ncbi:MAG: Y-family DNA polymerase [Bacteroides sp.]|nr:Y-family DNA polymerase [Bacteroides sp.]MCM1378669.1 Y-family DNA polymerase [Bacteroides sp.]MCM1444942.1 Y-family DNA polymerase [Prevotella sp.]
MIGLCDCNNFFVSCERVYRPDLLDRPVIVLSNNDGCAVALSNEAKALGFKRGDPYFKIKDKAEANSVAILSGNHRMYGDMSQRVMMTLRSFMDSIEIYSIDEAFLFPAADIGNFSEFGQLVARIVRRNTGIPVSLGFAPTKTLAKIAARFAKKYPGYKSCCVIDTDEKRRKALSMTEISDVWGVGRRNTPKLIRQGITTALQLADLPEATVKELFNIVGHRMWRELNGDACITQEIVPPPRRTVTASSSFKTDLFELEQLQQVIATHASSVARRLRRHGLVAETIQVFVATNRFHANQPQYFNEFELRLSDPTSVTAEIVKISQQALEKVFRLGYGYKKAGVTAIRCVPQDAVTQSLFANREDYEKKRKLMEAMDRINSTPTTHNAVHVASMDSGLTPFTSCEHSSDGILLIKV